MSLDVVCWNEKRGGSNETRAGAGTYPNYMIPVWKQRMFDRANNLTEAGIQEFLEAAGAGLAYRLVAYQGCRIIGLLSNLEREKYGNELRDRLARHGALETVTRAMGAHMVCPRVLAMGCIALQAMADGHREHSDTVIALGGAEVLPDFHTFFDSKLCDGSGTRRCHTRQYRSYATVQCDLAPCHPLPSHRRCQHISRFSQQRRRRWIPPCMYVLSLSICRRSLTLEDTAGSILGSPAPGNDGPKACRVLHGSSRLPILHGGRRTAVGGCRRRRRPFCYNVCVLGVIRRSADLRVRLMAPPSKAVSERRAVCGVGGG